MKHSIRSLVFILTLLVVLTPSLTPGAVAPRTKEELTASATVIVTGKVTEFTVTSDVLGTLEIKLEITSVAKGDVRAGTTLRIVSSSVNLKKNHVPIPGPQGLAPLPKKGDIVTAYLNPSPKDVPGKTDGTYAPLLPNGIMKVAEPPKAPAKPEKQAVSQEAFFRRNGLD